MMTSSSETASVWLLIFDFGSVQNSVWLFQVKKIWQPWCTICSYWRRFEAGRGLLLPWKQNVKAGLKWKMTWFVHRHVLSLEYVYAF